MQEGHIFIYGEVIPWQDDDAASWGGVNLKNVVSQISDNKEAEKLIVHIHSPGGDVNEGFAIHDALRNSGKQIETIGEGLVASIATVIFLAGNVRKMTENSEFFIHNPWGMMIGDSEEMQSYTDDLKRLEDKIITFYAEKTGQNEESLRVDMAKETTYTATDAKEKGFATEVISTIKAVAKYKPNNKHEMNEEVKEKLGLLDAIMAKLEKVFPSKVKSMVLQDTAGTEIDFPDLEQGAEPQVGDKATIDGAAAEGEFVMPDGKTFVFTAGELTEIKEAEENETEALKQKIAELEAQLETANASKQETTEALAQAKENYEKETNEFKETLEQVKAMIKSDTNPPKPKDKKDKKEEPVKMRVGFKRKTIE
jgi:ATP-dependent Clp endopeptidase proteolytic subunit ClpP